MKRIAILVLASAMLNACGSETEASRDGDTDRTAEGEVLGGTVTDDMIPLDQLKSQSPALEPVTTTTTTVTEAETDEGTSTSIERTVSVSSGGDSATAAPEPPQAPTPPQQ